ncbi:hypothetical protein FACS1894176_06340 [Bacteroidia bacterium]|nr:hypothetical protein FACS1894176_06340 [Bacteroidia bacterium]
MLGKLLTSPDKDVAYSIDPYDPEVELVFLNTCGFISSGREETFQTLDKLLAHGKKVCLIGCAVQYFEKVLPLQTPFRRFTPPSPLSGGNAIHGSSSCVFP